MCGNTGGRTHTLAVSNNTGYSDTAFMPAERAMGNKLQIGLWTIAITASTTVTIYVELSYDNGVQFKASTSGTTTAIGPGTISLSSVDATHYRVYARITTGTAASALISVTPNASNA